SIPSVYGDACAVLGKQPCDRRANPARAAGDPHDLVHQATHADTIESADGRVRRGNAASTPRPAAVAIAITEAFRGGLTVIRKTMPISMNVLMMKDAHSIESWVSSQTRVFSSRAMLRRVRAAPMTAVAIRARNATSIHATRHPHTEAVR